MAGGCPTCSGTPKKAAWARTSGAPLEYKHVWAVRHDGLVFASGWYVSVEEFTKFLVDEVIARYEARGLEATLASSRDPDDVSAQWYLFIASLRRGGPGPLQRREADSATGRAAAGRHLSSHCRRGVDRPP